MDSATLNALLAAAGYDMADLKDQTSRETRDQPSAADRGRRSGGLAARNNRRVSSQERQGANRLRAADAGQIPGGRGAHRRRIKAYYDAHKAAFQTPEKRSLAIILLDPDKMKVTIPTDAELRKDYAAKQDQFRTPERVNARHILIKSDESNDAAMKAKAEGTEADPGRGRFREACEREFDG